MSFIAYQKASQTDQTKILQQLASRPSGLDSASISERQQTLGPNVLPSSQKLTIFAIIGHQLANILIGLMFGATLLSVAIGHYTDAVFIAVAAVLGVIIGGYQEYAAEKILADLTKLTPNITKVRRGGKIEYIDSAKLVPGDIIIITAGNRVPADARILISNGLEIDESTLTGESLPQSKSVAPLANPPKLGSATTMLFMGTSPLRGQGEAVVTATGANTEIGQIARSISTLKPPRSPLQQQIGVATKQALWWILGLILTMLAVGLITGSNTGELLLTTITLAVAAIPEGLPALVTVVLVFGIRTMATKKTLVRQSEAIETLGRVQILMVDKTGTLTKNTLAVAHIIMPRQQQLMSIEAAKINPFTVGLTDLITAAAACNDSSVSGHFRDDPVDGAIWRLADRLGSKKITLARQFVLPFSSELKYMATFYQQSPGKTLIYLKGAPSAVIPLCHRLNPKEKARLKAALDEAASKGEKLVVVAKTVLLTSKLTAVSWHWKGIDRLLQDSATFIGALTFSDEIRPDTASLIAAAKEAGVRVVMATGDNALVAASIGHSVGLAGRPITKIDPDNAGLMKQLNGHDIFAEVTPSTKLQLVSQWQKHGYVVAMTGDGVNDSLALKKADVGIAMGRAGTDTAKDTSDVIILDDAISTIISAIASGRTIFRNVQRVIAYMISTNIAEVLVSFIAVLSAGLIPLPLLPAQILWINLVTDALTVVPLGLEPDHHNALKERPRRRTDPLLPADILRDMVLAAGLIVVITLAVFCLFYYKTADLAMARTAAFLTIAFTQMFNLLSVRSTDQSIFSLKVSTNPSLYISFVGTFLLQITILYLPLTQKFLGITPLSPLAVLVIIAASALLLVGTELHKYFIHRRGLVNR